jgi:tetratricopeptide (TPR) repeat protein
LYQHSKILLIAVSLLGIAHADDISMDEYQKSEHNRFMRYQAEQQFLAGQRFQFDGQNDSALEAYFSAWNYDPESDFLTEFTADFSIEMGDPARALYVMTGGREYGELADENLRYIGNIYTAYNEYQEALEIYREIDTLSYADSLVLVGLLGENALFREAAQTLDAIADEDNFEQQFQIADLYRRGGSGDSALVKFESLYELYPTDTRVKKGYGLCLLAYGDAETGLQLLHYYLPVSGGIPDPMVTEAVGRYYASVGNFRDAVLLFQYLYPADGSANDYYYGRPLSIYALYAEHYDMASSLMKRLLVVHPEDYELQFLLGNAMAMQEMYDEALTAYRRARTVNPEFDQAYSAEVLLYGQMGEMDSSVSAAEEFTQRRPTSLFAWTLLGSVLTSMHEFERAVLPLREAVALSGDQPGIELLFQLAMSYERSGRFEESEELFLEILERDPDNSSAANYLGYMWIDQDMHLRRAGELVAHALELEPGNPAYLDSYGWYLYRRGDFEEALPYLLESAESIDFDYTIYQHLGAVYEELQEFESAIEMYERALELDYPLQEELDEKILELRSEIEEEL